jgi:para-aminobenzoate synthetase component 1
MNGDGFFTLFLIMLILPIPYREPLAAFQSLARKDTAAFLDRTVPVRNERRISYLAADPFCIIKATAKGVMIDDRLVEGDPFTVLADEMKKYAASARDPAPVPFKGGVIGYFGYELGGVLEELPQPKPDALALPRLFVGFYDLLAAFDHEARAAWIIGHGAAPDLSSRAAAFARTVREGSDPLSVPPLLEGADWQPELTRDEVEKRIARVIEYIRAGDIFQANFTQRFRTIRPQGLEDWALYQRLRSFSPAPYAAFLRCGNNLSIASASPERFLCCDSNGVLETRPIKGTRPRHPDPLCDARLAQELETSAKDHAENLMIVDLMRNDLSRVSVPGSVKVPQLCARESFASIHHLVSVVTGQMRKELTAVDLLRAAFPGGSVTGAPKIRAMEIIHELEPAPRGIYCGAIGWIGFDQAMDLSMAIRILTCAGPTIVAQAGGGIVADSDPAAEYEESMVKMTPLLRALTTTAKAVAA